MRATSFNLAMPHRDQTAALADVTAEGIDSSTEMIWERSPWVKTRLYHQASSGSGN
jgi:hypothetical protein